jgi:methylmalonyl-CoA/ethylmalonyl-CoA epimerase
MPSVRRIDHVAVVVDDIESALEFWRDGLGLELTHVEDVPDMHSIVAFLSTGDSELELVKPTDEESGIARYLNKHGSGLHHICLEVDSIKQFVRHLRALDFRMINDEPIVGTGGKLISFIHPECTQGVLVELYEITGVETEIRLARARSLADRALSQGKAVASAVLGFLRSLRRSSAQQD